MTTNTPPLEIDDQSMSILVDEVESSELPVSTGIAAVASKLMIGAAVLFQTSNLEAQQTRPGTNQQRVPAATQPKPVAPTSTNQFKPTLGQPTAPKAVTPATKTPVTPAKPGTSVAPGTKTAPATLGTAKVAPRLMRRAPAVSVLKQLGDSCYQTIATELDEVALTNPADVQAIEAAFARLEVTRDAKEVDALYGALTSLMTHSADFKTPSNLDKAALSKVATLVREIMAAYN